MPAVPALSYLLNYFQRKFLTTKQKAGCFKVTDSFRCIYIRQCTWAMGNWTGVFFILHFHFFVLILLNKENISHLQRLQRSFFVAYSTVFKTSRTYIRNPKYFREQQMTSVIYLKLIQNLNMILCLT